MNRQHGLMNAIFIASTWLGFSVAPAAAQWNAYPRNYGPQGGLQPMPAPNYAPPPNYPYPGSPYSYNENPYQDRYTYPGVPPRYGAQDYYYRPDYPPYRYATPRQLEDYDNRADMYRYQAPLPPPHSADRDRPSVNDRRQARIQVVLPNASAQLWIDGEKSSQAGATRLFRSPELNPNKTYYYAVMAAWPKDGKLVTEEREIEVNAGELSVVDFTVPARPQSDPPTTTRDERNVPPLPAVEIP